MPADPMRILVICPYDPYPAVGGGKLRIYHLVTEWLRLGHDISLWTVPSDEPDPSWPPASPHPTSVRAIPARARDSLGAKIACLLSRYPEEVWMRPAPAACRDLAGAHVDLVILMQAHVGRFARPFLDAGVPVMLDQQNVEGEISAYLARLQPTRMGRMRARLDMVKWGIWERSLINRVCKTVAVSEADATTFRRMVPTASVVVRPSGADLRDRHYIDHSVNRSDRLIMTGTLGYMPNLDAARWMIERIMPIVRQTRPRAHLMLVGASAPPELRAVAPPWVEVVGRVPEVNPFLDEADLFVAPLRAGGGTRLKLLEAFAVGLPVVATTIAVAGLDARPGEALVTADDEDDLAAAIVFMLEDVETRRAMAESARRLVERSYAWSSIAETYQADLLEIGASR